jgi:glutaredoxin 3
LLRRLFTAVKMDIKIYTNVGCGYCAKAKELCKRADLPYTEVRVGKDISAVEFREQFPQRQSYPQIVINDEQIGGLVDAVKYFVDNKLITRGSK